MTSNREGDFDSILDDDSLDDATENLEALEALSENTEFLSENSEDDTEESRIKVLSRSMAGLYQTERLPQSVPMMFSGGTW